MTKKSGYIFFNSSNVLGVPHLKGSLCDSFRYRPFPIYPATCTAFLSLLIKKTA